MARVQPYERVVDAVIVHTSPILDVENEVKIKEEPIDTILNTTEDCMLFRNRYSLIDHNYHSHEKSSLPKTDTLHKEINNREDRHSSNDDFVHSNDTKTVNIESKNVTPKQKMHNTLQLKKQKYSNKVFNNDTNVLRTTTENVRKRKQQNIISDCKIKKLRTNRPRKKKLPECNICFRLFSSFRNCEFHKQYYETSDNICRVCKKHFASNEKLQSNMCPKHKYVIVYKYKYNCNFCNRTFKTKALLQSHLFHIHGELICFNNTTKHETSKPENVNTSPKDDTSRTSTNVESCSDNLKKDNLKSQKINTTLINVNKSCNNNIMDTDKSTIENSFNNEMSPKKLRQPTLTEYLELCKKKRDIKPSPNKLNLIKDLSVCTAPNRHEQIEEHPRPKHNSQIDSLSTKSDNLAKQITPSTQKQTTVKQEIQLIKKPFVRLHADVEMMKSFLEKLSDVDVTDQMTSEHGISDSTVYDRDVPYKLRSLNGGSSMETDSNSRMKRNKISKKSQANMEFNIKQKQNIDIIKVNPEIDWKEVIKYKKCTIPLTRCDKQSNISHQITATDVTENTSLTTQCNSTLFQESDIQNKVMLKDLEVSLERLTAIPATQIKTELNVEQKPNDYFSCKVCKERFPSKLAKHAHIKSTHLAYMSSICNARYKLKHKLLQHYLSEHLFKQNQCCICYTLFPDYKTLKQHLTVHCIKYIQKQNDQYPVDVELKCRLTEKPCKCLHCDETFSSQLFLELHKSCCVIQEEMEKDKEDSVEKASEHPKNIPDIQHKKNTNKNTITCDERINPDDSCKSLNSDCVKEKLNELQTSVHNEKELKISEVNRNCLASNNLIEKKDESVNKSQDLQKLSENNNSTTSNQDIAKMQLNELATRTMTYPCNICGKQFQNPKNLEIHIRTFNFTTDICPMCGTGFSSKRLLQTHITAAHVPHISKTYSFHCVFCNQGFFKKHDLRPHILHLHGQQVLSTLTRNYMSEEKSNHPSVRTSTCSICNLVFETHDCYIEHRLYYYKNHMFTCSLCDKNFQGMYMFHHHNKLVHSSEDKRKSYNYICNICSEGFNHESHFHSHNMHVHSKELNPFETGKEERLHLNYSLEEKTRNISTDQPKQNKQPSKEYTCEVCQQKCADLLHMTKHKEFYSNDGDFKCDKCNRRYRTFYLLDQHRNLTHIYRNMYNGHACNICGEVLETGILLKCHEKHFHSNTGNNTNNWENGDQIPSSSITEIMERLYKFKNSNITEYNCLFCDMKFLTASTVQTHIVHVHMDDMIAKRSILKLTLPITNSDYIQKQYQFDTNLALSSSSSAISSVTSSSSSSAKSSSTSSAEDNSTQLLQRSTVQFNNALHNNNNISDTSKNNMTDKTTTDKTKLKNVETVCSKNNTVIEKTPVSAIPCTNTSKDISTVDTIAPNTKSNTDTSVSTSIGQPIFKPLKPGSNYKNFNTSVQTNEVYMKSGGVNWSGGYLKSGSINETSSVTLNRFITINKSKKASVTPLATGFSSILNNGSKIKLVIPNWKSNEIRNQTSESSNNYSCPLCPLQYPSLMFFHAHLKYAHAESIRNNKPMGQSLNFQAQKNSTYVECLLCPLTFINETKYKQHLRSSHTYYVYIPNSEEMTKISNVHNPPTESKKKTDIVDKSTIPETITVEDDDESNIKDTDQGTTEVTVMPDPKIQNEKIGKLRVKPFAKIIENLSTESALKFLN